MEDVTNAASGQPLYIDTVEALAELSQQLSSADWVALDTEFLRERTYYPKICLVQIATADVIACVDPLAVKELGSLLDVVYNPAITKVFHACSQDIEIFMQLGGKVPAPIFDTQIAAPLLGLPEQVGYATLVHELLGIELHKAHTRTDWSKRPLSGQQIRYALDDVRYLANVYPLIRQRLTDTGRMAWLEDDFRRYEDPQRYHNDPDKAWMRIRGHEKLRVRQLSILQVLAAWREKAAQSENKPRAWVLKDELLIDLARIQPGDLEALAGIQKLSGQTVKRYGQVILDSIRAGRLREPDPIPARKKKLTPDHRQEALAEALQAQLTLLADANSINPASLASRKQLLALACGDRDLPVLKGWRYRMAGKELLALLAGERVLSVRNNELSVTVAE